jgi:hypothetical protein
LAGGQPAHKKTPTHSALRTAFRHIQCRAFSTALAAQRSGPATLPSPRYVQFFSYISSKHFFLFMLFPLFLVYVYFPCLFISLVPCLFISLVCLFPLFLVCLFPLFVYFPYEPPATATPRLRSTPRPRPRSPFATWQMGRIWHRRMAHGDMGTWGNQKPGNAHHNGIGEISCSMRLIVASERNVL